MCSTVHVAQCVRVCVCGGEGGKMFFHSQLTFSDSKDNIIWPQMSPLTSANKIHNATLMLIGHIDDNEWHSP